jgi:hypothetical protein
MRQPLKIVKTLDTVNPNRCLKTLHIDIKNAIRKLKINALLNGDFIHFDKDNIPNVIKKLVDKYSRYGIITGSTLLSMYGLVSSVGDLDIIVNKENYELLKNKINFRDNYTEILSSEYIGYIIDDVEGGIIDVFLLEDSKFENVDNIKIDSLSRALEHKNELLLNSRRIKDYTHLETALKCLNENYYISMCDTPRLITWF